MWLYSWVPLTQHNNAANNPHIKTHFLAKFNDQRTCGGRNIKHLIWHVALQGHVMKGSCDSLEGSYSLYVTTQAGLVVKSIVVMEIYCIDIWRDLYVAVCSKVCVAFWVEPSHTMSPTKQVWWHWRSGSRDVTDIILHVTFQDHVIKSLCDFIEGSSSLCISILLSLVVPGIAVVNI